MIYKIYSMPIIDQICAADYFVKKWEKPRYPINFWLNFLDNSTRNGFDWIFTTKEISYLANIAKPYLEKKVSFYPTLNIRVRHHPYTFRLRAGYKMTTGTRWIHTTSRFHTATSFFTNSFWSRIHLIRDDWAHYTAILKAESLGIKTKDLTENCYINFNNTARNMAEAQEQNFITNFVPLINQGAIVKTYTFGEELTTKSQACPDGIINLQNAFFVDKFIHGIDQKHRAGGFPNSKAYSGLSDNAYFEKLRKLQNQYAFQIESDKYIPDSLRDKNVNYDPYLIDIALKKLKQTCNDFDTHQLIWAESLHLFHNNFIPALKLPSNFSLRDFKPETISNLNKHHLIVKIISNYLIVKQYPAYKTGDDFNPIFSTEEKNFLNKINSMDLPELLNLAKQID